MRIFSSIAAAALTLMLPAIASADIQVTFDEGAPKDRFTIANTGACALESSSILLDLSTSEAGLIFDVTGAGAGVEVFQPFEIIKGADALSATPTVTDGQKQIEFQVAKLAPGQEIAFTIDVDDTLGTRAITVSGSEIAGASVTYTKAGEVTSAAFSTRAVAQMTPSGC